MTSLPRQCRCPKRVVRLIDIDELADPPGGLPVGVLAHTGRSGSTLFAKLLALDPSLMVVSEPDFVIQCLTACAEGTLTREESTVLAGRALGQLAQLAVQDGRLLAVKTTSWTTSFLLEALGTARMRARSVFLWREPLASTASLLRRRPFWLTDQMAWEQVCAELRLTTRIPSPESETADFEIASSYWAAVVEARPRGALEVEYDELIANPRTVLRDALRFFGSNTTVPRPSVVSVSNMYSKGTGSGVRWRNHTVAVSPAERRVVEAKTTNARRELVRLEGNRG